MHGHGGHGAHGHGAHDAGFEADDGTPFLTSDKIVLLIGLVAYGIGQSVLFIVLQPLVEQIGLTLDQFGYIMSISNLALALAAIYWGRRSDKVGRKPMLLFGLFGYALGSAMVAGCIEWGLRGSPGPTTLFVALLLARLVYGVMASAINPSATAYMADTTTRAQRSRGMALIGLTSGVGTLLGPAVGGLFAYLNPVAPMYAAITLALLAAALIGALVKEPERHDAPAHVDQQKLRWYDGRVLPFLILLAAFWMSFTMIQIITAFYIEKQVGVSGVTNVQQAMFVALICMALAAMFMQLVVIQVFNISTRTMFRVGLPIFVVGLSVLYVSTNTWMVAAGFAFMGASLALANAGITGGASLSVEPHEQGAVGGLLSAAPILGMVGGPLVGTQLFSLFSPTFPVLCSAVLLVCLSLYALTVKVPDR